MTDVTAQLAQQVRIRVLDSEIDLHQSSELAEGFVGEALRNHSELALAGLAEPLQNEAQMRGQVLAALTGYGKLQTFLDDDSVEEIWINSPSRVFIARNGRPQLTNLLLTEAEVRDLVERMLNTSGRRVDRSSPFVDASLPDGSRLHVVIPDVTRRHWAVNIRKFNTKTRSLSQLVELGMLGRHAAEFLRMSLLSGINVLVSGPTHAGKTTLLRALLGSSRPEERLVTLEETFELELNNPDVVALQCRQPNLEGKGEVTLRHLVKEALRMRPERLVIGEVRQAEALDLLLALNSGVPGACTIHANSASEALEKLCLLPLLAGTNVPAHFVTPTVARTIGVVVHCELGAGRERRVSEIVCPTGLGADGQITTVSLFKLNDGVLSATGNQPPGLLPYETAGYDPAGLLSAGAQ